MEKKVVALPAAAGLLVQTDLGRLECTPPCARVGRVQADKHKRTMSTMNR